MRDLKTIDQLLCSSVSIKGTIWQLLFQTEKISQGLGAQWAEKKCVYYDYKRLWWKWMTLRFTGFLDFVHYLVFIKDTTLERCLSILRWKDGKLITWIHLADLVHWLSVSNGPKWVGASLLFCPTMETDPVSKMLCSVRIKENGQSPETQYSVYT
jgi:hypothetical protein